jgi:hypothetical protein
MLGNADDVADNTNIMTNAENITLAATQNTWPLKQISIMEGFPSITYEPYFSLL